MNYLIQNQWYREALCFERVTADLPDTSVFFTRWDDFLIYIRGPGDHCDEPIPFYAQTERCYSDLISYLVALVRSRINPRGGVYAKLRRLSAWIDWSPRPGDDIIVIPKKQMDSICGGVTWDLIDELEAIANKYGFHGI